MHCVSVKQVVDCSHETIFNLFWDIEKWVSFWSPLKKVSLVYDDGFHQEFVMEVDWDGRVCRVRTIRFRVGGNIQFFSPLPPPPTICHQGEWKFSGEGGSVVEVEATRHFTCAAGSPANFAQALKQRLRYILDGAKQLCEN